MDIKGYEISGEVTDTDRAVVEQLCRPLTSPELLAEFSKLDAKTKRKAGDEMDTAVMVAAYAEELQEYPADVVRYVLKMSARNNIFFPAWAELYEDLEFWGRRRMMLADAILGEYHVD